MKKTNFRSEGKSVSSVCDSNMHFHFTFTDSKIYVVVSSGF